MLTHWQHQVRGCARCVADTSTTGSPTPARTGHPHPAPPTVQRRDRDRRRRRRAATGLGALLPRLLPQRPPRTGRLGFRNSQLVWTKTWVFRLEHLRCGHRDRRLGAAGTSRACSTRGPTPPPAASPISEPLSPPASSPSQPATGAHTRAGFDTSPQPPTRRTARTPSGPAVRAVDADGNPIPCRRHHHPTTPRRSVPGASPDPAPSPTSTRNERRDEQARTELGDLSHRRTSQPEVQPRRRSGISWWVRWTRWAAPKGAISSASSTPTRAGARGRWTQDRPTRTGGSPSACQSSRLLPAPTAGRMSAPPDTLFSGSTRG
jgi:hypothetical protein